MRISDWSSDVCSSDLIGPRADVVVHQRRQQMAVFPAIDIADARVEAEAVALIGDAQRTAPFREAGDAGGVAHVAGGVDPCDARVDDEMIDMGDRKSVV